MCWCIMCSICFGKVTTKYRCIVLLGRIYCGVYSHVTQPKTFTPHKYFQRYIQPKLTPNAHIWLFMYCICTSTFHTHINLFVCVLQNITFIIRFVFHDINSFVRLRKECCACVCVTIKQKLLSASSTQNKNPTRCYCVGQIVYCVKCVLLLWCESFCSLCMIL